MDTRHLSIRIQRNIYAYGPTPEEDRKLNEPLWTKWHWFSLAVACLVFPFVPVLAGIFAFFPVVSLLNRHTERSELRKNIAKKREMGRQAGIAAKAERDRIELHRQRDYWTGLRGVPFEQALSEVLSRNGYKVSTTSVTGDGGVDLIAERTGRKLIVQCKAQGLPVGVGPARELNGVLEDFQGTLGVLASPSGFTQAAIEFAANKNHRLRLIGLDDMIRLVNSESIEGL